MQINNLFSVKDKVVLVTGGGRGVGEHITEGFVVNGAKVYITGRKKEALEKTCSRLNSLGKGKCIAIPCDLSNMESLQKLVVEMKKREKVNNAGVAWGSNLEDITSASYHRVMDLNVKSLLLLTTSLLPELKAAGSTDVPSRVINIGSVQGIIIGRNTPLYDASKAAVHHLTKALAGQLASDNVLVNAIALGIYETTMGKVLIEKVGRENAASNIPLGRTGQPHEIAGLCLFLASRASTYIVGSTIVMDGGVIAGKSSL